LMLGRVVVNVGLEDLLRPTGIFLQCRLRDDWVSKCPCGDLVVGLLHDESEIEREREREREETTFKHRDGVPPRFPGAQIRVPKERTEQINTKIIERESEKEVTLRSIN
jgi:hypothetical protein